MEKRSYSLRLTGNAAMTGMMMHASLTSCKMLFGQKIQVATSELRALRQQLLVKVTAPFSVPEPQANSVVSNCLHESIGMNFGEVINVALHGTADAQAQLRTLCRNSDVAQINQDFVAPYITAALKGDQAARAFVEANRLIIEEDAPAWAQDLLTGESHADWRKFRLDSREMARYVKTEFGHFQYHPALPSDCKEKYLAPVTNRANEADLRNAFLTLGASSNLLQLASRFSRLYKKSLNEPGLFDVLLNDLQSERADLTSPTIVGDFYRKAASIESRLLFTCFLVDDICLALDLPLSSNSRIELVNRNYFQPWGVAKELVVRQPQQIFSYLQSQSPSTDTEDGFSAIVTERQARRDFLSFINDEVTLLASSPHEPSPHEKGPATGEQYSPETRSEMSRSARLLVYAALQRWEQSTPASLERDRRHHTLARQFDKVIGISESKLDRVLKAIECRGNLEDLLIVLRCERRAPFENSATDHPLPTSKDFHEFSTAKLVEPETWQILRTSKVSRILDKNSRARHAYWKIISSLEEDGLLLDKRKIVGTSGVWEFREHNDNYRVYYFYSGQQQLCVFHIGPKKDQKLDIPKLQKLRDEARELIGK